jgi:hypothetical protein
MRVRVSKAAEIGQVACLGEARKAGREAPEAGGSERKAGNVSMVVTDGGPGSELAQALDQRRRGRAGLSADFPKVLENVGQRRLDSLSPERDPDTVQTRESGLFPLRPGKRHGLSTRIE